MASERYSVTRFKVDNLEKGVHKVKLYKHYLGQNKVLCEKTVIASHTCGKYIYLKYLASDGRYKFMMFDRNIRLSGQNDSIGEGSAFPYSLDSMVSPTYSLGYSSVRTVSCGVVVDAEKYAYVSDILSSPKVYMQIKEKPFEVNDLEDNWLEVTVQGSNEFPVKKGMSVFNVTVTLPEYNSITKF